MTVSSVSGTDQSSLVQQLLASLQTTMTNTFDEIDSAESSGSTPAVGQGSAAPAGPPPGPPPPRPDGSGSDLFSSDTLAGLMQAQEQPTSASDAAAKLISSADTDGSGTLSLAEIEQALDGSSSSTDGSSSTSASSSTAASGTASSDLQAAFAKLDTNGDGQLSQDEIAAGLQKMQGAHHGHHHHHGAYAAAASSTDAATSATASTTSTDSTTGTAAATDVTA